MPQSGQKCINLDQFLQKYKAGKGESYTHTRIGSIKNNIYGSYFIPKEK